MAERNAVPGEYLTEREEARERLKASIDALADRANLQVQMQKEPLKMLGGASAVGAVIGMVVGRQFRRSKKIYVDAASPVKHQKALMKAQSQQQSGKGIGGALIATLGTLAVKTLTERVITPKLEELSSGLLVKAGQAPKETATPSAAPRPMSSVTPPSLRAAQQAPAAPVSAASSVQPAAQRVATQPSSAQASPAQSSPAQSAHPGVKPMPESKVEVKAVGTPIAPEEASNPNLR